MVTGGILGNPGGTRSLIANDQTGQARRIAVMLNGNYNFQNDVIGQILAASLMFKLSVRAMSAKPALLYRHTQLTPSGEKSPCAIDRPATTTPADSSLSPTPTLTDFIDRRLIVDFDQNDRNYTMDSLAPQSQSSAGQSPSAAAAFSWVGDNGGLGGRRGQSASRPRTAHLRPGYGWLRRVPLDIRNTRRGSSIAGGTGTIRTSTLDGGGFNSVQIGTFTLRCRPHSPKCPPSAPT